MNGCGIVYAIFYLKEVAQQVETTIIAEMEPMNEENSVVIKNESQVDRNVKCSEIFSFKTLQDSLNVVIRKRKHNGRTVVLLLFLMTILYNGIFTGAQHPNFIMGCS